MLDKYKLLEVLNVRLKDEEAIGYNRFIRACIEYFNRNEEQGNILSMEATRADAMCVVLQSLIKDIENGKYDW